MHTVSVHKSYNVSVYSRPPMLCPYVELCTHVCFSTYPPSSIVLQHSLFMAKCNLYDLNFKLKVNLQAECEENRM